MMLIFKAHNYTSERNEECDVQPGFSNLCRKNKKCGTLHLINVGLLSGNLTKQSLKMDNVKEKVARQLKRIKCHCLRRITNTLQKNATIRKILSCLNDMKNNKTVTDGVVGMEDIEMGETTTMNMS